MSGPTLSGRALDGPPLDGVVVLGMHRSGTSAVSRALNLLGAAVPGQSDLLVNYDNPDGHWESKTLVALNDRILAAFGRSWDFPPHLGAGWEAGARVSGMVSELEHAFAAVYPATPWVWKDPRTCLTFPLWRGVLGDHCAVVLVHRSAPAVARSLWRRDGIPRIYGAGLWLHYLAASLSAAAGMPVVSIDFDELRAAPLPGVERLAADLAMLGLALPGDPRAAAASVHADPGTATRHPKSRIDDLVARLTEAASAAMAATPRCQASFAPPALRTPAWVAPVLAAYRGPWVVRSRLGHPLRARLA